MDSHSLQHAEGGQGAFGAVHHDALRHFQHEPPGGEPRIGECPLHHIHQIPLLELAGRNVNRHLHWWVAGLLPLPVLAARGPQHPFAQGNDEPRFFREGDEARRRHEPHGGVLPADQGLHARDLPVLNVDLGLIVEHQLFPLKPLAQVVFKRKPLECLAVHLRGVELAVVPPLLFGPIHGKIGVLHQGVARAAIVGKHADADARGDEQLVPINDEGGPQAVDNLLGHFQGIFHVGNDRQIDDEFVAPLPGHGVAVAATDPLEALGHLHEELVSHRMPEGIVDQLEPVQIEKQH
ncbi:MAG: hypothetical protein ACD_75C02412G0002 [uncultured bacterium]|nr:MAG: hypothetical protein ACD_75C02412G0002 [uncultured bacterium]